MEIITQTPDLVICIKPVGVDSEKEMPQLLAQVLPGEFFPVHRLDMGVGGLMVFARSKQAAAKLGALIAQGQLKKEYLALVHGCPEEKTGRMEDLLWKDSRKNKVFVVKRQRAGVRSAAAALSGGPGRGGEPGARFPGDGPQSPDPCPVCFPGLPSGGGPQVWQPGKGDGNSPLLRRSGIPLERKTAAL